MVRSMTSGNPIGLILAFTVPLLIGNVFQQFYNIADIIIVGRTIGVNALAAVGAVAPVYMAVFGVTIGLSAGFSVIVGQRASAPRIWTACAVLWRHRRCWPLPLPSWLRPV